MLDEKLSSQESIILSDVQGLGSVPHKAKYGCIDWAYLVICLFLKKNCIPLLKRSVLDCLMVTWMIDREVLVSTAMLVTDR